VRKKHSVSKEHPVLAALILFLIAGLTTLALSSVHFLTAEIIARQAQAAADKARHEVFVDAASYEEYPESVWPAPNSRIESAFLARDEVGMLMGFVIVSTARGYGGEIAVMTGISMEGSIRGIQMIYDSETPGLGKKISDSSFTSRFLSRPPDLPFSVSVIRPDYNSVDALAGATISSRAMTDAVNTALEFSQRIRNHIDLQGGS
jgi:Na+-translocating ferredoxin:NAD+ oxidoreductase subunit G